MLKNGDTSVEGGTFKVVTTWRLIFVTYVLQRLESYFPSTTALNGSIVPAPKARGVSRIGAMAIGRGESNFRDRNSPTFCTQIQTSGRDLLHRCSVLKMKTANFSLTLLPACQTTRHYTLEVINLS